MSYSIVGWEKGLVRCATSHVDFQATVTIVWSTIVLPIDITDLPYLSCSVLPKVHTAKAKYSLSRRKFLVQDYSGWLAK
jgi:hypothetical protein